MEERERRRERERERESIQRLSQITSFPTTGNRYLEVVRLLGQPQPAIFGKKKKILALMSNLRPYTYCSAMEI